MGGGQWPRRTLTSPPPTLPANSTFDQIYTFLSYYIFHFAERKNSFGPPQIRRKYFMLTSETITSCFTYNETFDGQ